MQGDISREKMLEECFLVICNRWIIWPFVYTSTIKVVSQEKKGKIRQCSCILWWIKSIFFFLNMPCQCHLQSFRKFFSVYFDLDSIEVLWSSFSHVPAPTSTDSCQTLHKLLLYIQFNFNFLAHSLIDFNLIHFFSPASHSFSSIKDTTLPASSALSFTLEI